MLRHRPTTVIIYLQGRSRDTCRTERMTAAAHIALEPNQRLNHPPSDTLGIAGIQLGQNLDQKA